MTIRWIKLGAHHLQSDCGRFSINRAGPVGPGAGIHPGYLAWVRSLVEDSGCYPWGVIGCYPTAEKAADACQQHARFIFHDAT